MIEAPPSPKPSTKSHLVPGNSSPMVAVRSLAKKIGEQDAGEIWIEGQNIIGLTERQLGAVREKIGILFQGAALFDSMTVAENIAFPLREAGERNPKVLREKVREMLDVVELEGQEEKMPESLSGGMKKRVGLARSIVRRPSCVLYDEPTSGLDPVVSDSINHLIRRLQERL